MDKSYRQYNIWWDPKEGEEAVYDPWIKDQSEQWHNGFVYKGNYYGALKDDDYHKALREERLKHILYYSLETVKDVDFTLSYGEGKYPLYEDDSDTPMSLTAKVKLATTFNYWDEANECPPCVLMNPNWTKAWKDGCIIGNSGTDSSGMDFVLSSENDGNTTIVAIQITKYIIDEETGNRIKLSVPLTNDFDIYTLKDMSNEQKAAIVARNYDETFIAGLYDPKYRTRSDTIDVGLNGVGSVYEFHVKRGMVGIHEDPESIPSEIVDVNGERYVYTQHTRIEDEYAWRGADAANHKVNGLYAVPEVVGSYTFDNWENYGWKLGTDSNGNTKKPFNSFEEYFVYNYYRPKDYPVYIRKVDSTNKSNMLSGAEFDLYGPYTAAETGVLGFNAQDGKKPKPIVTGSNGEATLGYLKSGIYYLYETKAPDGFNMLTEPVVITVDSAHETPQGDGAVGYSAEQTISQPKADYDPATRTYTLTIPNSPGARLPETGGVGTTVFYVAGGLLSLLALALLILRRRAD